MEQTLNVLKRWHAVLLLTLLALLSACGSGPAATPDATGTAVSAATILASLPTAAALTPRSTRQVEPTETPAPLAVPPNTPAPTPEGASAPAAASDTSTSGQPDGQADAQPGTPVGASEYTVQAGDTLLSIALANKVSMAAIALLNDMGDSQVVKLGQVLRIPAGPTWPNENVFWFVYIVQPGEALSSIAARFDVRVDDLVQVNQLADASAIQIGQNLVIPASAPAFVPEPTPRPRAEDTSEQEAVEVAVAEVAPLVAEASAAVDSVEELPTELPAEPQVERLAEPLAHDAAVAQVEVDASQSAGLPPGGDVESERAQLLALYNQERAAAGLAPLSWSPVLQQGAQAHAEDCAARGFGSHVGSDGADLRARLARAGYGGGTVGENWGWSHTAQQVFDAWFTREYPSGPHRDNILSPRYSEVGFGIAQAHGGYYFIANFGTP